MSCKHQGWQNTSPLPSPPKGIHLTITHRSTPRHLIITIPPHRQPIRDPQPGHPTLHISARQILFKNRYHIPNAQQLRIHQHPSLITRYLDHRTAATATDSSGRRSHLHTAPRLRRQIRRSEQRPIDVFAARVREPYIGLHVRRGPRAASVGKPRRRRRRAIVSRTGIPGGEVPSDV